MTLDDLLCVNSPWRTTSNKWQVSCFWWKPWAHQSNKTFRTKASYVPSLGYTQGVCLSLSAFAGLLIDFLADRKGLVLFRQFSKHTMMFLVELELCGPGIDHAVIAEGISLNPSSQHLLQPHFLSWGSPIKLALYAWWFHQVHIFFHTSFLDSASSSFAILSAWHAAKELPGWRAPFERTHWWHCCSSPLNSRALADADVFEFDSTMAKLSVYSDTNRPWISKFFILNWLEDTSKKSKVSRWLFGFSAWASSHVTANQASLAWTPASNMRPSLGCHGEFTKSLALLGSFPSAALLTIDYKYSCICWQYNIIIIAVSYTLAK